MYGVEIIVSAVLCILVSIIIYILSRRTYDQTDIVVSTEDIKPKTKTVKKSNKIKIARKESAKITQPKKALEEEKAPTAQKRTKKEKQQNVETAINVVVAPTERVVVDQSAEWKKVSKTTKKVIKKETTNDANEEKAVEEIFTETKAASLVEAREPMVIVDKNTKPKKNNKQEPPKSAMPSQFIHKEMKSEADKHSEVKTAQKKETVVIEEYVSEEISLQQRIGELMAELDKQKNANKEENKASIQIINQLNKELDTMKQKMKVSQLNEEKSVEELRKRNASFDDIKLQFVIVQKELTKTIVLVQSMTREKEKMNGRLQSLEKSNHQLTEKSEMFDTVNAELEDVMAKLAKVEEEYKEYKNEYSELLQGKEVEYSEKINQLQLDRQRMQEQLVHVQTDLLENNSKLQSIQQELLTTKNTHTDLLNDNIRLQKNCAVLENASVLEKQQQLSEITIRHQEHSTQLDQVIGELNQLKEVNEKLKEENIALLKRCEDNVVDNTLHETIESLTQELNNVKHLLSQTNVDSDNHRESHDNLTTDINNLRTEKDNLLTSVEHYKTELENTESALLKLQISFGEEETKWQETITKTQSEAETRVTALTHELDVVTQSMAQMEKESNCDSDKVVSDMDNLRKERDSLLSLVEHYKAGLENTETILSNLQISVNDEEEKWRESLLKSESEAEKCSKELEKVHNELLRIRNSRADKNELNFAYHCVDRSLSSLIDEMETRMNQFESNLEEVITERDNALAQVHMQMNGDAILNNNNNNDNHTNNNNNDIESHEIKDELNNQKIINDTLIIDNSQHFESLETEKTQVQSLKEEMKQLKSQLPHEVNDLDRTE